jgi:multisubunit Na+/H+ antiporter MnhC subunit
MPIAEAFIVAAIVAGFVIFAAVLAWAEYQTRYLSSRSQEGPAGKGQRATATFAKAA